MVSFFAVTLFLFSATATLGNQNAAGSSSKADVVDSASKATPAKTAPKADSGDKASKATPAKTAPKADSGDKASAGSGAFKSGYGNYGDYTKKYAGKYQKYMSQGDQGKGKSGAASGNVPAYAQHYVDGHAKAYEKYMSGGSSQGSGQGGQGGGGYSHYYKQYMGGASSGSSGSGQGGQGGGDYSHYYKQYMGGQGAGTADNGQDASGSGSSSGGQGGGGYSQYYKQYMNQGGSSSSGQSPPSPEENPQEVVQPEHSLRQQAQPYALPERLAASSTSTLSTQTVLEYAGMGALLFIGVVWYIMILRRYLLTKGIDTYGGQPDDTLNTSLLQA